MGPLLAEYLDELFFQGEQLATGTKVLVAVLLEWPHLGRGARSSLPQARQALQGWLKLNPHRARLPIHWKMAAAIADVMLDRDLPWAALTTVLSFHAFLRPGVAADVRIVQFAPPIKKKRKAEDDDPDFRWTLNLHPFEHDSSSKTGTWDETVELGHRPSWQWVGRVLDVALAAHWRSRRLGVRAGQVPRGAAPIEETVLGMKQTDWVKLFRDAALELKLPKASDVHLYRLRHGGASHDTAHRVRTLDEVAKRGAWRSYAFVARYSKPGRVNDEFSDMPRVVRAEVLRRAEALPGRLQRWPLSMYKKLTVVSSRAALQDTEEL